MSSNIFEEQVRIGLSYQEKRAAELGMTVAQYEEHLEEQRLEREAKLKREEEERKAIARAKFRRKVADDFTGKIRDDVRMAIADGTLDLSGEACAAALDWWTKKEKPILVLSGGTGTGKTVAAVELLARFGGEFVPARYLGKRHDPWKEERELGTSRIDLEMPLIVIDDLGTERIDDPRFLFALEDTIDCRQSINYRTLITTNLNPSQFRDRYQARFADRLNGIATAVYLKGDSMRRNA